jgi:hypothetical protein
MSALIEYDGMQAKAIIYSFNWSKWFVLIIILPISNQCTLFLACWDSNVLLYHFKNTPIAFISAFSYGLPNRYLYSKLLLFFILLIFSKKFLTSKSEWLFYCYLDGMMAADLLAVLI